MTRFMLNTTVVVTLTLMVSACGRTGPGNPVGPDPNPTPASAPSLTTVLSGEAIAGAAVEVVDKPELNGVTNREGWYLIEGVKTTTFKVKYERNGYLMLIMEYRDVRLGSEHTGDVKMTPRVIPPGPILVPWSQLPPISNEAKDYIVKNNLTGNWYSNGAVTRWNTFPIKVYADPYFTVQDVADATNIWTRASNGKITFRLVSTRDEADMTLNSPPRAVFSNQFCAANWVEAVVSNVITKASHHFRKSEGCKDESRIDLAQNIGFILGLDGFTAEGTDLMSRLNPIWNVSPLLSEIVNWLYSVEPGTRPE